MIHARIVDTIAPEDRGPITHALMGTTPPPAITPKMAGAKMPPVGVRVRELPRGNVRQTLSQLGSMIPGMGGGK